MTDMIKKIVLFFLMSLAAVNYIRAQDDDEFKTIFQKKEDKHIKVTGFGGPMMAFTAIENDFAHMMGGGGAILVGNTFFGGYGMGKTNKTTYKHNEEYNLGFGHGGLWVGHIFGAYSPVHLALSAQVGWGNISLKPDIPDIDVESVSSESIFVLTPNVELEMNFSRFLRLGIGGSISYVTGAGITRTSYTTSDFFKPALTLSLKFGYFY
jgi:hypothetical protein